MRASLKFPFLALLAVVFVVLALCAWKASDGAADLAVKFMGFMTVLAVAAGMFVLPLFWFVCHAA